MDHLEIYRRGLKADEERKQLVRCVSGIVATSYISYSNVLIERKSPDCWRVGQNEFSSQAEAKRFIDEKHEVLK